MFPNISAEQARRGMTNRQLASNLSVSEKTITNWKNGKTNIPSEKLIAMSRMFGVTIDYLLGATGAKPEGV